jgi:hypothetical protein
MIALCDARAGAPSAHEEVSLKRSRAAALVFLAAFLVGRLMLAGAQSTSESKPEAVLNEGKPKTIRGLVRDLYCPMQNLSATAHDANVECAVMCLRAGSPIVIQSESDFYFPISDSVPDKDQRPRLMPFAGKQVEVTGIVYVRNGVHAITIKDIRERPER